MQQCAVSFQVQEFDEYWYHKCQTSKPEGKKISSNIQVKIRTRNQEAPRQKKQKSSMALWLTTVIQILRQHEMKKTKHYLKIPSNGSTSGSQASNCVLKVDAAIEQIRTELITSNRPWATSLILLNVMSKKGVI